MNGWEKLDEHHLIMAGLSALFTLLPAPPEGSDQQQIRDELSRRVTYQLVKKMLDTSS